MVFRYSRNMPTPAVHVSRMHSGSTMAGEEGQTASEIRRPCKPTRKHHGRFVSVWSFIEFLYSIFYVDLGLQR